MDNQTQGNNVTIQDEATEVANLIITAIDNETKDHDLSEMGVLLGATWFATDVAASASTREGSGITKEAYLALIAGLWDEAKKQRED